MFNMEDTIQCTKRIYRIQTSTGVIMEVERDEPLSEAKTAMLLEEDHEIKSFLGKCNILSVEVPENPLITRHIRKVKKKKLLKRIRHNEGKQPKETKKQPGDTGETPVETIGSEEQEIRPEEQEIKPDEQEVIEPQNVEMAKSANRLTPCDRINMMITMEGEFIRKDYMKFLEDKNYRMTDFMGYGDIEEALLLGKIELTGERVGKGNRKYRVIDTRPIEQYTYRKMKKSHKEKRRYR